MPYTHLTKQTYRCTVHENVMRRNAGIHEFVADRGCLLVRVLDFIHVISNWGLQTTRYT